MRSLLFTESNEAAVRSLLFSKWEVYYARRRWQALDALRDPTLTTAERRELEDTRYIRSPAPTDLSGACKIAAQVAVKLFALDGEVISNERHTFVVMRNGEIYDFNRRCRDVNSMLLARRQPYEINHDFTNSPRARQGRESWRRFIGEFMTDWSEYLTTRTIVLLHKGPLVSELPAWAKVPSAPITAFPQWRLQQKELP